MGQGFTTNGNIVITGSVDTNNSSTTPLNSSAVFTGTATEVVSYPSITFACLTDQNTTIQIQFSPDGTNWDSTLTFYAVANLNEVHKIGVTRKYYRIVATNTSASNQTFFRLQAILGSQYQLTSSLSSQVQADADTIVVRPLDFNLMVAESLYQNRTNTIKDGLNEDIDLAGNEDVWTNGGFYTGFPSSASAGEIVVAGADTGTIYYSYMATDTDTDYTFGTLAITGAGTYALGHNIWRSNFAYFVASSPTVFNVGLITLRHTATPANVFWSIPIGYGQTYCSAYTVPYRSSIYLDRISGSMRGSATGSLDGFFYYKPYNESARLRFPFELQYGTLYFDDIDYLVKIPERVDIMPRIITSSANNLVAKISYRFIKVKES